MTESGRVSARFDEHFFAAVAPLRLSRRDERTSRDALVDLLHGVALAGPGQDARPQIDLLLRGILALADT